MSSTAMLLSGHGITINTQNATPGSLNSWLKVHHGYTSRNDFIEGVLTQLDPRRISWTNTSLHKFNDLKMQTREGTFGRRPACHCKCDARQTFCARRRNISNRARPPLCERSGFFRIAYNLSDVVGWRLFAITDESKGN